MTDKDKENKFTIQFDGKQVRRVEHNGKWYFSIIDIIEILTDSPEPASYWAKIKKNDPELRRNWTKLKMQVIHA